VDTLDAMADVEVAPGKSLESVGAETPVPDLIAFILPINKFLA
jgi:hypothetical protein